MARTRSRNEFLALLSKSRLLPPETITSAVERYHTHGATNCADLGRAFVADALLTPFQLDQLLDGRCRGFFFGSYQLRTKLDRGGFGFIYIARHLGTGRRVAVKLLSDEMREVPGIPIRFDLEWRVGQLLDHPRIAKAIESGESGGTKYIVFELVKGMTLHEMVAMQGPLPWEQACDIICQSAAGLQHAQCRGVVHRDVKPRNLLVDRLGRVKIVDFGLASLEGAREDEFTLAMLWGQDRMGTADFVAPEQSRNSYAADARADIYGLGATLYFALTAQVPFPKSTTLSTLAAHADEPIPDPRVHVADVPEPVVVVLRRMMAKSPADRIATMTEVRRALTPFARRASLQFDFDRVLELREARISNRDTDESGNPRPPGWESRSTIKIEADER